MSKIEKTYVSPEMEIVKIDVEQCIMTASAETLGHRNDELEW